MRVVILSLAGALIVGLVGLMAWGLSNRTPVTGLSGVTRVLQPAPDFRLPLFGDGELALSELKGRPLVMNFWASWCAPCRDEAMGLERAWRSYAADGVMFIGIDIQDSEQNARAYLNEFGITYPNGRDDDGRITVDYGVVGLPVTFFVNKAGIVERRWVGAIPESRLLAWVAQLVQGGPTPGEREGENTEAFSRLDEER